MIGRLVAVLAIVWLACGTAAAQDDPSRPVAMVVPFPADGPSDAIARILAQAMGRILGRPVIVENAGGGGPLAAARVAAAAPDGHTVLFDDIGLATGIALHRTLSYDPLSAFVPIGLVTEAPMTLVARDEFPADDANGLIDYVKANAGKVSYGDAGMGSASHLCGLLFMHAIGTRIRSVSHDGTGSAMRDLLDGRVDVMCEQITSTADPITTGEIRVYGVTTASRIRALPNVPTLDEAGLPGFDMAAWHGLYAPAGTARATVDGLAAALRASLAEEEVIDRFAELTIEPVAPDRATPEALGARLKAETERWVPIIRGAGIHAD